MARSAVAPDAREYPEYEFREYPKHLGFDEAGVEIVVAHADEEEERKDEVAYPKPLGHDRHGKPVIAMWPHEEVWKAKLVVAPKEPEPKPVKVSGDPVKADDVKTGA